MKSNFLRRATGIMMASLVACGLFFGCAKEDERRKNADITITFAGRSNDNEFANYQAFIDAFMEENPECYVDIQWSANESAYMSYITGLGDQLPDLFMLSRGEFVAYASSGLLYDYKDLVDRDALDSMYDTAAEAYLWDKQARTYGTDIDDENTAFYGYSKDQGPYAICYNKSALSAIIEKYNETASVKLSLPSATEPMTYAEFLDYCSILQKCIQRAEYKQLSGCSDLTRAIGEYSFEGAIYSNNADFFTDSTAKTSAVATENFIQAIEFYQDIYELGLRAPYGSTESAGETSWINEKSLFFYCGPYKCKDYWQQVDFEWDLMPMAVGPAEGAVSTAEVGTMGYCIGNNASDDAKVWAAKLAEYLATNENAQMMQYRKGQAIPNVKSLANDFITDKYGVFKYVDESGEEKTLCPANRSVWIDMIDGVGGQKTDAEGNTYTDKVGGKFTGVSYTYSKVWRTTITDWIKGNGTSYGCVFGDKNGSNFQNVRESLTGFDPVFQGLLDAMQVELNK